MPEKLTQLKEELRQRADKGKAKLLQRFFKTGPGEYAEGDKFLGVMVPQTRQLVKKYWREISIAQTQELLQSKYHEERLLALFILVAKFKKADDALRKEIFDLYLANTKFINNWDLVDLSAPNIVGSYLYDPPSHKAKAGESSILFKLAKSKSLWERRIAILATFYSIGKGEPQLALKIAEILVNDKHDLIHKAVGWMLREVGKRCSQELEEEFLEKHYRTMPRTMLRYAIERFSAAKRKYYLAKSA
jgi:3-methyladenine DNA glycosylase AlkD